MRGPCPEFLCTRARCLNLPLSQAPLHPKGPEGPGLTLGPAALINDSQQGLQGPNVRP